MLFKNKLCIICILPEIQETNYSRKNIFDTVVQKLHDRESNLHKVGKLNSIKQHPSQSVSPRDDHCSKRIAQKSAHEPPACGCFARARHTRPPHGAGRTHTETLEMRAESK